MKSSRKKENIIDILTDDLEDTRVASARDILNNLGPISKEEVDYYENL